MAKTKQTRLATRPELSERETTILRHAADGLTDKEIGKELGIGVSTIRTYWDRLRDKLGAVNRAQAIALGMPRNRLQDVGIELAAFVLRNIEDEAIFIVDENGTLMSWNLGVEKVFGYTEEEWIGQLASIFFIPSEKEDAEVELEDADTAGASVNDRWHMRKDGSRFWGTNLVIALEPPTPNVAFAKIVREKTPPTEVDPS